MEEEHDDQSEDTLDAYLELILRVHDEIASDPERYQKLKEALKKAQREEKSEDDPPEL